MKSLNLSPSKKTPLKINKFGNLNLVVAILIFIGIIRIALTYNVFWQTADEPAHIAAGMEWLDKGTFTYEHLHPPLARVVDALGLFLSGIRSTGNPNIWNEGNAILQMNGLYEQNLMLARLGVLSFFVIATLIVWKWTKLYFGELTALLSVILLTTLPPVLAHSGVATTDMAFTAMFVTTLFTFCLWLEKPTLLRTHLLGITLGLTCLTKFSALVFLPVSLGSIAILYYLRTIKLKEKNTLGIKRWIASVGIAILICLLTIWAGYRFSYDRIINVDSKVPKRIEKIIDSKSLFYHPANFIVKKVPLPAPEFFSGIIEVSHKNKAGHPSYLFGEVKTRGWWYFFPVLLLVKTPLPFLLLTAIGFFTLFKDVGKKIQYFDLLAPAVVAIAILIIGIESSINIGLRHLLPIYPLLAIVAGYGGVKLRKFRQSRGIGTILLTLLLIWQLGSSFKAHPDYLPYFNLLAGNHPEKNFGNSDQDWGQDLKRLATTLKNRKIKEFSVCYNGSAKLRHFDFPQNQRLIPYEKTTGWIAVSTSCLRRGTRKPPYDQYSWLEAYNPVELVGKSIYLYYISELPSD